MMKKLKFWLISLLSITVAVAAGSLTASAAQSFNDCTDNGVEEIKEETAVVDGEGTKVPVFYALEGAEADAPVGPAAVSVVSAVSAPGETVKLKIKAENNPGIVAMRLKVGYNSDVFTLLMVEDGGILGQHQHSNKLSSEPYTLFWFNPTSKKNYTESGVIATLVFRVADDAPLGDYSFTLDFENPNNIVDKDIRPVDFEMVGGQVTLSYRVPGDANGNGITEMLDCMYFYRYLANWDGYGDGTLILGALDLNGDGAVNTLDAIILTRHVANWVGYDTLPL